MFAGQKKSVALGVNCCGHGRGITCFVPARLPEDIASRSIKRNDAGTMLATNIEQHSVAFTERRAGDSEEAIRSAKLRFGIDGPNLLASGKVPVVEHSLRSESKNLITDDQRG